MDNFFERFKENKAAVFDWTVFAISFSLGFIFPTLMDLVVSPVFSFLMLGGLVLYTAGVYLKKFPLYYRIAKSGKPQNGVPLTIFLIIGHWLIMYVVSILSVAAIRKIIGLSPLTGKETTDGIMLLVQMGISFLITWMVFRPVNKKQVTRQVSSKYLLHRELIADILLVFSVSVFSFAFWEKGMLVLLGKTSLEKPQDIGFLFLFLALAYMLVYLPLRYLFLIEDHHRKGTWKRMMLIFFFLMVKALFEWIQL